MNGKRVLIPIFLGLAFVFLRCFGVTTITVNPDIGVSAEAWGGGLPFTMCKAVGPFDSSIPGIALYAQQGGQALPTMPLVRLVQPGTALLAASSYWLNLTQLPPTVDPNAPIGARFTKRTEQPIWVVLTMCGTGGSFGIKFPQGASLDPTTRLSFGIQNTGAGFVLQSARGVCHQFLTGKGPRDGQQVRCDQPVALPPGTANVHIRVFDESMQPLSVNQTLDLDLAGVAPCTSGTPPPPASETELKTVCEIEPLPPITPVCPPGQDCCPNGSCVTCYGEQPICPSWCPKTGLDCSETGVLGDQPICASECPQAGPDCSRTGVDGDKAVCLSSCPLPNDVASIPVYPIKPAIAHISGTPLTQLRIVPESIMQGQCMRFLPRRSGVILVGIHEETNDRYKRQVPAPHFVLPLGDPNKMPQDDPDSLLTADSMKSWIKATLDGVRSGAGVTEPYSTWQGYVICLDEAKAKAGDPNPDIDCAEAVAVDLWACAGAQPEPGQSCEYPNVCVPRDQVCNYPKVCVDRCLDDSLPTCQGASPSLDCERALNECPPSELCERARMLCPSECPRCDICTECEGGVSPVCPDDLMMVCEKPERQPAAGLYKFFDYGEPGDDIFVPGGRVRIFTSRVGERQKVVVRFKRGGRLERLGPDGARKISYDYFKGCKGDPAAKCAAVSKLGLVRQGPTIIGFDHPDPNWPYAGSDKHECQSTPCDVDFFCWHEVPNPDRPDAMKWEQAPCGAIIDSICVE